MLTKPVTAILLATAIWLQAAPRLWLSADGQRGFAGEFVERDATRITIRNANGRDITIPLAKLHQDDQSWINTNHPLAGTTAPTPPVPNNPAPVAPPPTPSAPAPAAPDPALTDGSVPDQAAVFDQLVYGESRAQVLAKLKASKFVEPTIDVSYLGRTGLNGVFRTRKQIGGLDAALFFGWTPTGELKELTLQTEALPADDYRSKIEPSWKEFIILLTNLYGKPVQQGSLPRITGLADGSFSPSHLWALDGGSALLGTARDGDKYQLVVRFRQGKYQLSEFR